MKKLGEPYDLMHMLPGHLYHNEYLFSTLGPDYSGCVDRVEVAPFSVSARPLFNHTPDKNLKYVAYIRVYPLCWFVYGMRTHGGKQAIKRELRTVLDLLRAGGVEVANRIKWEIRE